MRIVALVCVSLCCAAADRPGPKAALRQLRFSPNGRYVLTQDDAEVTVLTVAPFAILFRIPAVNATDAQFTPDSQQIVFVSSVARVDAFEVQLGKPTAHVERWRISDPAQIGSFAVALPACGTTGLSPDGRVIVCLDMKGTLTIVNVAFAQVIFVQKRYATAMGPPDWSGYQPIVADPGSAQMEFSPDGHYLVVLPHGFGSTLGWDLFGSMKVELRGGLRYLNPWRVPSFAFVAPVAIIVGNHELSLDKHGSKARLVAFPSGKVLAMRRVPPGPMFRAADPDFVIVRPFGRYSDINNPKRAAAIELSTGQMIVSESSELLDVFGRYYVTEPSPGSVGLYQRGKGLQATVVVAKK